MPAENKPPFDWERQMPELRDPQQRHIKESLIGVGLVGILATGVGVGLHAVETSGSKNIATVVQAAEVNRQPETKTYHAHSIKVGPKEVQPIYFTRLPQTTTPTEEDLLPEEARKQINENNLEGVLIPGPTPFKYISEGPKQGTIEYETENPPVIDEWFKLSQQLEITKDGQQVTVDVFLPATFIDQVQDTRAGPPGN